MNTPQNPARSPVPVGFFAIAVGLLALAKAWSVAVELWHLPQIVADALTAVGAAAWLAIVVAYAHKWLFHRAEAQAEMQHPVQSSFSALGPVSTLLAATALLPYSRPVALALFAVAMIVQLALGLYLHGRFWQGGRKPELVTPAIYLPAVAQNFVAGTSAAAFGWPQVGAWFFGAGLLSWLAIESLILHRAAVHESLPALRPSLGIQLAPPVVGGVTYLSLSSGVPDLFAQILLGYGLYQALLLLRLLPWIREQSFSAGYWSFSFGVAALPTMAMRMVERGSSGPIEWLTPGLFVAANLIIGTLAVKTLVLLLQGKLLPVAVAPVVESAH
ncbi:MAG: dicarboxylate transporter/tellurite-resistance protein TehA [Nevskia sp.]|nr:dicarboxylate transporter/tellurite-resistance protein TehA [Nevskia sp.]